MSNNSLMERKSTASQRERRKQVFRDKIMEAAIELFDKRGCEAVTLEEICELAAVSRPTFYSYYATKQELIQALGEKLWLNVTNEFAQQAIASEQSTKVFVQSFFRIAGEELTKYSKLEKELIERSMGRDSSDRMTVLKHLTDMFAAVYVQGRKRGEVGDLYPVDFLAEMTMGSVSAVMMNWAALENYPIAERLQQLSDYIPRVLEMNKPLS